MYTAEVCDLRVMVGLMKLKNPNHGLLNNDKQQEAKCASCDSFTTSLY